MDRDSLVVPASEAELSPEWLGAALAGSFPGAHAESAHVARIGEGYGLSSRIFRCRLSGAGMPGSVVVKLWPTDGPAGTRELQFYESFARELGVRVPACHHAASDTSRSRGVLVLEDLEGATQGDCLEPLDARGALAMAGVLAALHATWWERPELAAADWLPSHATRDTQWLRSRRGEFLARFGDGLDPTLRALLERVEPLAARADERLSGAPITLLHGDLHLDNVLFEADTERPVLMDWARVTRGPAVLDLAELLFAMGSIAALEPTLEHYLGALRRRGVHGLDDRALERQLGGALLRKFVTTTCGVARWQPASEREQRMIELGLRRIVRAIERWRQTDPELLGL